jgi:hypothetical protein
MGDILPVRNVRPHNDQLCDAVPALADRAIVLPASKNIVLGLRKVGGKPSWPRRPRPGEACGRGRFVPKKEEARGQPRLLQIFGGLVMAGTITLLSYHPEMSAQTVP